MIKFKAKGKDGIDMPTKNHGPVSTLAVTDATESI